MIENLPKAITAQVTHLKDPDMFWDFISLMPMTTHQVKCFVQEIFPQISLLVPDLLLEASFPSSSLFKSKTLMQAMQWYFDTRSLSFSPTVELPTVTDSWTGTIEKWKLQRKNCQRNHSFNQIWLAHVQDGERGQRGGVLQVPLQDRPGHQVLWQVGRGHRHNHCHCQDETISIILMILFYRHQADEMAKQDPDYAIRWTHQLMINDPILSICNQLSLLCVVFSFLVRWMITILAEICTIRYPMETSPRGRCTFRYSRHSRLQLKFKPIQTITMISLCVLLLSISVFLYFGWSACLF